MLKKFFFTLVAFTVACSGLMAAEEVKIGLNYPQTGPYATQGQDELRAAELAAEEINAAGGILGKKIVLVTRDTMSKPDVAVKNAAELIDMGAQMIFGGVSSGVAKSVAEVCQQKGVLFMATVAASNDITDENGHRYSFRVCYNAWMSAKALGKYMRRTFAGKKYFYITANYSWGNSSEESLRKFTGTTDMQVHKVAKTPFPVATDEDFAKAAAIAKQANPDVLVLVLFGDDMAKGINAAIAAGLKKKCKIVVPILELALAEKAGPQAMEGVLGTSDWNWAIPYKYNYTEGISFVKKFAAKHNRYPCWGASSAYTNLHQYASAVKRAKSFKSAAVVKALEGHSFTLLKDQQQWRDFDHQNVQSVYIVQCKPAADIEKDPLKQDYFEILQKYTGPEVVKTKAEWDATRAAVNKSAQLEPLDGGK